MDEINSTRARVRREVPHQDPSGYGCRASLGKLAFGSPLSSPILSKLSTA
ncbi:hypothetical protein ES703_62412 [subsurface metagenome]